MALAQLYSRTGDSKKSEVIMASLTGASGTGSSDDFFAPALRDDSDPAQAVHDADKNLNAISNQFEAGEYDHLNVNSFSAMDMVALSWARMGWARFLQGDNLVASQFLDAAWELSQSGTVANRLAKVYEKTGAKDRARHMYALAAAAGGPESQSSRQQVMRLNATTSEKDLAQAMAELEKMKTIAVPQLASATATARFIFLFDNSSAPDRVQFLDGDEALRGAADKLQAIDFPVKFPDVSSIKVIRLGTASCRNSVCKLEMQPLNSMQGSVHPQLAVTPK